MRMLLEKLHINLYRLAIPLPIEGLKHINVYIVKDGKRALIVDTGMGNEGTFQAFLSILKDLDLNFEDAVILITHFHIDHFGFAKRMLEEGAKVLVSKQDWERILTLTSKNLVQEITNFLHMCGYPENHEHFPYVDVVDSVYSIDDSKNVSILEDEKNFSFSDYQFTLLFCPGHTPGHLVLYERNYKFLISGDTLLKEITPTIQARNLSENPLSSYIQSILKISRLDIDKVLPSHGDIFEGVRERIEEIREHHEERLLDVISALRDGKKTVYQISSSMRWDTQSGDFLELPFPHKIFAMGEALAHINYLLEEKRLSLVGSFPWIFNISKELEVEWK